MMREDGGLVPRPRPVVGRLPPPLAPLPLTARSVTAPPRLLVLGAQAALVGSARPVVLRSSAWAIGRRASAFIGRFRLRDDRPPWAEPLPSHGSWNVSDMRVLTAVSEAGVGIVGAAERLNAFVIDCGRDGEGSGHLNCRRWIAAVAASAEPAAPRVAERRRVRRTERSAIRPRRIRCMSMAACVWLSASIRSGTLSLLVQAAPIRHGGSCSGDVIRCTRTASLVASRRTRTGSGSMFSCTPPSIPQRM